MVQSYKNESKSQRDKLGIVKRFGCDVWYKVTKMRANHNTWRVRTIRWAAVMYGTKLQKWEQITTKSQGYNNEILLWCMVQSYKNESKSQLVQFSFQCVVSCDVWYKVTKMRANHNNMDFQREMFELWCMVQSYKNESKSQRIIESNGKHHSCDVWYKVTKMRANHNVSFSASRNSSAVMYGTKLQKWEQITTKRWAHSITAGLWCMVQSYKNESKSQLMRQIKDYYKAVMYGTKLQKWEQITT